MLITHADRISQNLKVITNNRTVETDKAITLKARMAVFRDTPARSPRFIVVARINTCPGGLSSACFPFRVTKPFPDRIFSATGMYQVSQSPHGLFRTRSGANAKNPENTVRARTKTHTLWYVCSR